MLPWFRKWRTQRLLRQPFPDQWNRFLSENLWQYDGLNDEERKTCRQLVQFFMGEMFWEGCNDLELTEEMRLAVAGYAALPFLHLPYFAFKTKVKSILVYPEEFYGEQRVTMGNMQLLSPPTPRIGEAWPGGPVVLSWADVMNIIEEPDDGQNVVIHEFAHQFDMHLSRIADGNPPMENDAVAANWQKIMAEEFEAFSQATGGGRYSEINPYGRKSAAEFFAVTSEYFFQNPALLQQELPRVFEQLSLLYRVNPLSWAGLRSAS